LPFCHRELSARKLTPSAYPTELKTIGDHIRKRRLDLGLLQREVAQTIGVDVTTIFNWEKTSTEPDLRCLPAVIKFLGYDPRLPVQTVGEKLRRHREALGLSLINAAKLLDADPATVRKWEIQPDSRQNHTSLPKIVRFLSHNPLPEADSPREQLRQCRLLAGLTQGQLADKLGVCQDKVWRWENGRQQLSKGVCELVKNLASDI
jgi:transcriptional regulator with XRE-family HTH domain